MVLHSKYFRISQHLPISVCKGLNKGWLFVEDDQTAFFHVFFCLNENLIDVWTLWFIYNIHMTFPLLRTFVISWGFSSAFECAQDVGQFEVSVNILTSLDGVEYDVPRLGYLNDRFYFRLSFSSGDIMTGAELVQMQITTQEGNPICAGINYIMKWKRNLSRKRE